MKDTVSQYIENQFPAIYREEGQALVEFLTAYYEYLEDSGHLLNREMFTIRDIDETFEEFIKHFRMKYIEGFPYTAATDERFLVKNIIDFYRTKGSEQSIKLLMRLIFNDDVEVYYPRLDVLKVSDSRWVVPQYIECASSKRTKTFVNKRVTGSKSKATALVESIVTKRLNGRLLDLVYVTEVKGNFQTGDLISDDGDLRNAPRMIGSLTAVTDIEDARAGYKVGDKVNIVSPDGINGIARISKVFKVNNRGVDISLLDGGYGYTTDTDTNILISDTLIECNNAGLDFIDFETIEQKLEAVGLANNALTLSVGDEVTGFDSANTIIASGFIVKQDGDISTLEVASGSFKKQVKLALNNHNGFVLNETVEQQSEIDLTVSGVTGTFSVGEDIIQSETVGGIKTNIAIGVVSAVANNVITATEAFGTFEDGLAITGKTSGATATLAGSAYVVEGAKGVVSDTDSKTIVVDPANNAQFSANSTIRGVLSRNKNEVVSVTNIGLNHVVTSNTEISAVSYSNVTASGVLVGQAEDYIGVTNNTHPFIYVDGVTNKIVSHSGVEKTINKFIQGIGADFNVGTLESTETVELGTEIVNSDNAVGMEFSKIGLRGVNSGVGKVDTVTVVDGGSGYANTDVVTFTGGGHGTRRNDLTRTEEFDHGDWQKFNSTTVTANSADDPNGATTADTISFGATNGHIYQRKSAKGSTDYIYSVWMRTTSGTFKLKMSRTDGVSWSAATVSPELTVTTTWQRFELPFTTGPSDTTSDVVMGYEGKTPYSLPATGSVLAWGAQLEETAVVTDYQKVIDGTEFTTRDPFVIAEGTVETSNGVITAINVTNPGEGYWDKPEITVSGGSGAVLKPNMIYGFGFGKNPYANMSSTINSALGKKTATIGAISKLKGISRGAGYFAAPFFKVRNPFVESYHLRDVWLSYGGTTGGTFKLNEIVESSSGAKGRILEIGLNKIKVRRITFNYEFHEGDSLTGLTSTVTVPSVVEVFDSQDDVMGDNANVRSYVTLSNGVIAEVEVLSSGYGYYDNTQVTLIDKNKNFAAYGTANLGKQGKALGFWETTSSHINDKKIHDNRFYQEYSYQIKASISFDKYEKIIRDLLHTAGMEVFGEVVINTNVDATVNTSSSVSVGNAVVLASNLIGEENTANVPYTEITLDETLYSGVGKLSLETTVIDGGTGYNTDSVVTFTGGGKDANTDPTIIAQGEVEVDEFGSITSLIISHPGEGYWTKPEISIADGSGANVAFSMIYGYGFPRLPYSNINTNIADALSEGEIIFEETEVLF